MALIDQYNLTNDSDFKGKVQIAMVKAAVAIAGESYTEGKDILGNKRHNLAVTILSSPLNKLEAFVVAVAQNAVITGSSSDSDIEFTVNSIFDDIAGVKQSEI